MRFHSPDGIINNWPQLLWKSDISHNTLPGLCTSTKDHDVGCTTWGHWRFKCMTWTKRVNCLDLTTNRYPFCYFLCSCFYSVRLRHWMALCVLICCYSHTHCLRVGHVQALCC